MKKNHKAIQRKNQKRKQKQSTKAKEKRKEFKKVKLKRLHERIKDKRLQRETAAMEREVEKMQNRGSQIRNNYEEKGD